VNLNSQENRLREAIARERNQLTTMLNGPVEKAWEDGVYRFYHQSHKVFRLQKQTEQIVAKLQALLPGHPLAPWFVEIVDAGTNRSFGPQTNSNWSSETRPIVEAFSHAKYFLEMACKEYEEWNVDIPVAGEDGTGSIRIVDSGWSALLALYGVP